MRELSGKINKLDIVWKSFPDDKVEDHDAVRAEVRKFLAQNASRMENLKRKDGPKVIKARWKEAFEKRTYNLPNWITKEYDADGEHLVESMYYLTLLENNYQRSRRKRGIYQGDDTHDDTHNSDAPRADEQPSRRRDEPNRSRLLLRMCMRRSIGGIALGLLASSESHLS